MNQKTMAETPNQSPQNAPMSAEALYQQGDQLHDLGQREEALRCLEAAIRLDPAHWLARYTCAVVLQDLARHEEAAPIYEALLADGSAHPKTAKAWLNLGVACHHSGDPVRAETAYRNALALTPGSALAAKNLADLLADQGDADAAHAVLAPFLNADEPSPLDLCDALILPVIAESEEAIFAARQTMRRKLRLLEDKPPVLTDPLREIGRTPFFQIAHGFDDRVLLESLARVYRRACPALCYVAPHVDGYQGPKGKIRVGFLSGFFSDHSVGRAMVGLIESLPRDQFEVSVCFIGQRADATVDTIAARITAAADRCVDVPYEVFAAQERLGALGLDILMFADVGLEPLSHLLSLGRFAPLQCTSWGQPETSGSNTIDDYISVDSWEGGDDPDARYSENLVQFKGVATPSRLSPPDVSSGAAGKSLLRADTPSFFCPHSALKLHPDFDDLLADILMLCPNGFVYLIEPGNAVWAKQLRARLNACLNTRDRGAGELARRVVWLGGMSRADYFASLSAANVLLDTPYFGSGPTLLDAIACGTPFVTLGGEIQRARMAAGLLKFMSLSHYLPPTSRDYVAMAVRLATDPPDRKVFSDVLLERAKLIFDDARVTEAWADYFSSRIVEVVKTPGPRPVAYGV